MNIFIDTNIFLSFYHLTSDDLEELRKLSVLLGKGGITLYLPEQVIDEYRRNRENKIADAIKKLKEQKLNLQFPQLCKDYAEYPKLRALQKEYEKEHSILISNIAGDVDSFSLKADKIIEELFNIATHIATTDDLIDDARVRMDKGNPPGKNDSLGDAINWEALLEVAPENEGFYFISDDKDYYSSLDANRPKEFLVREWNDVKHSSIIFYRRLSAFFKDHYPSIKLASDLYKGILISQLATSGAFATTHNVIAELSMYDDYNSVQANDIVRASLSNPQVNWIISDPDVFYFLDNLVRMHKDKIDVDYYNQITDELEKHIED